MEGDEVYGGGHNKTTKKKESFVVFGRRRKSPNSPSWYSNRTLLLMESSNENPDFSLFSDRSTVTTTNEIRRSRTTTAPLRPALIALRLFLTQLSDKHETAGEEVQVKTPLRRVGQDTFLLHLAGELVIAS